MNHDSQPNRLEIVTDQERRSLFLRYINISWLIFGFVTLVAIPIFPELRSQLFYLAAVIFPTYLAVRLLNSSNRSRAAGIVLTASVNFGFYGLFVLLINNLGAEEAFRSQATVWMLMGLAVLLAGATVTKWAGPVIASFNTLLFIATKLIFAPKSDQRPSLLVFWWMMAVIVWLYERTLQGAFSEAWKELAERKKIEVTLRESEAIYRQAIEVSGAVPYRQSYRSGSNRVNYDFIGDGILQLTGYRPQEFNPAVWDAMVQETHLLDDLAGYSWDEAVNKVRVGDIPVWKCEYRIQARDGSTRWVFESGVELRNEQGVSHGSVGLFQDITKQKEAEARLRDLTRRIVAAQEEERKHIAQELHDELGQALTAISLDLGSIEKALDRAAPEEIRQRLIDTRRLANEVDDQIGELALNLRPSLLDDLGLLPTLKWHLDRFSQHLGIEVTLECTGLEQRLSNEVETTLYRVIQEALTNVARHAQAGAVHLRLERGANVVTADIQDDGQGFDVEAAQELAASSGSLGLFGIRDRVTTLGGWVEFRSEPGHGACIHIEIPLENQE